LIQKEQGRFPTGTIANDRTVITNPKPSGAILMDGQSFC
jgi:hypothetical protein